MHGNRHCFEGKRVRWMGWMTYNTDRVTLFCFSSLHSIRWLVADEIKTLYIKLHGPIKNKWLRLRIYVVFLLLLFWRLLLLLFPTEYFFWALKFIFPVRRHFLSLPSLGWHRHLQRRGKIYCILRLKSQLQT
jgi:hypothetical protein